MATTTAHLTKLQAAAAACVIAAAATITPAAIAEARPDLIPASPMSQLLGSDPIQGPIQLAADVPFWWYGNPNNPSASVPQPGTIVFQFTPLALLPGFIQPYVGWFLQFIPNFAICFAGLGASIGPYLTFTVRTGAC